MTKPITYWVDTPAIQSLCKIYGPRLEEMPIYERTTIMTALSAGINSAVANEDQSIATMTSQLMGDTQPSHPSLYQLLIQLDRELDNLQDALYLVAGIAMSTPLQDLEAA